MAREPERPSDASASGPPPWLRTVAAVLLVVSVALAAVSLALPMGKLEVDTTVGPVGLAIDANFTMSRVNYTGVAPGFGLTVGNDVAFLGGTGEFQEKVGFLKGTAKDRTNIIKPFTDPELRYAQLNVTVRADTIPWWVVGVGVPCHVEVELVSWANVSELTVDRAYLEFRIVKDGRTLTRPAWDVDAGDRLESLGQRLVYSTEVSVPEDWGEFQLFGMVNVTMKDSQGTTATHVLRSYSSEPKVILLWSLPTSQGAKVALAAAAMPVAAVGLALAAASAALVLLGRRGRLALAVTAAVLLLLGAAFLRVGVGELATVFGFPDADSYSAWWWLALAAFAPAAAASGMLGWAALRWPEEGKGKGMGKGKGKQGGKGEVEGAAGKGPAEAPKDVSP